MAIFKILEGPSSRIDLEATPFHQGWAYFTPDDGGLYIDSEVNGERKRIRVVAAGGGNSIPVSVTLSGSGWISGKQTVAVPNVTAESNGIVGVSQSITPEEMEAVYAAKLRVCGQGDGTVTVAADGTVPTRDIPVVVVLLS